jgi:hypothetical protein
MNSYVICTLLLSMCHMLTCADYMSVQACVFILFKIMLA